MVRMLLYGHQLYCIISGRLDAGQYIKPEFIK